ncbi:MAG TPA: hypothetical protein VFZ69_07090 [Longimicrobiales bacterium]
MRDRDNTDVWTAVAIGAIVGVGATLLMRAQQEDDTYEILKRLRPVTRQAKRTAKVAQKEFGRRARQAGDTGEELLSAGREIMDELRSGARDIVRSTRNELRKAARDAVKDARKAARNAARRF